jgi:NAD(P)-dependent dehydrogenase (short-subunit alcohol dehydrogenase family)
MPESLQNEVCLVTGGASGIGRAIALEFADHGGAVVIADQREDPRGGGKPTHERIQAAGGEAAFVGADVRDPEDIEKAVEATAEFGPLSVMVNNAAVLEVRDFMEITEAQYDRMMSVNAKGTFFGCQAAARAMLSADGGSIINLSSGAGIRGSGEYVHYCASKAAIRLMTYALADRLGPEGIRVNAIHPGVIESEMTKRDSKTVGTGRGEGFKDSIPMGRFGNPGEISSVARFLASDESSYVNGESILVDGGVSNTT